MRTLLPRIPDVDQNVSGEFSLDIHAPCLFEWVRVSARDRTGGGKDDMIQNSERIAQRQQRPRAREHIVYPSPRSCAVAVQGRDFRGAPAPRTASHSSPCNGAYAGLEEDTVSAANYHLGEGLPCKSDSRLQIAEICLVRRAIIGSRKNLGAVQRWHAGNLELCSDGGVQRVHPVVALGARHSH